ncbi:MAG: hypothetical protein ABI813_15420 [Bacteroidota bacterium]
MKKIRFARRPVAAFMLLLFTCNMALPFVGYALTSGPVQPEMKGFEPAGTTDLVDPFTGDFTYNIPLMDVGGYPVNIAYHSGSGMDDEASWVGFGWSLSPGVIDRQMRGLPDDFNGNGPNGDKITKAFHLRNDITGGVDFSFSPEVFGFNLGQVLKAGVQAGVFYNNKRGLGIQVGLNANAPLLSNGRASAGTNTAGLSAGASLSFNSQNGASFNPSINFAITAKNLSATEANTSGLNLGGSFQSRAGLQAITLGASFQNEKMYKETQGVRAFQSFSTELASSYVSYAAQSFLPETQADYFNESFAVSPQFGPQAWGFFAGLQLTGHYSMQKVANPFSTYNAYGFLHCSEGKNDHRALMDFNREKDVPYYDGVPNLPIPVATPDLFMVHAQDGSAQYRAYLGGTGIFSDHDASNTALSASLGVEVGAGAGFKIGADLQASLSKTITTKWKTGNRLLFEDDNSYDAVGNFTGAGEVAGADYEPVYFKRTGEPLPDQGGLYDKTMEDMPVRVKTQGNLSGPVAKNSLAANDHPDLAITQKIARDKRAARNNSFGYLTNDQVKTAGLNKKITDYYLAAGGYKPFLNACAANTAEVKQSYKKGHHIGEITITDDNGGRKVYGIPAYNTWQEEVSFSIGQNARAEDKYKGLVDYSAVDASVNNNNGLDHFYSKEIIPAYAHSFLLSGILSADYTDVTGDGITDDDLGTAIRFNYWRKTDGFQWRTPYAAGKANYNEGLLSDKMDDRGNYSYGRKELWYLHSIESKTMVAVFETGNREDALGADAAGYTDTAMANRQQYLKSIRLYAKADWNKSSNTAVPLKTVHFVYDYSLFADGSSPLKGVPNNTLAGAAGNEHIETNQGGKLTLKTIYFTYQGNTKGVLQPYRFQYDFNRGYEWKQYDRWGNYKNATDDNPPGVVNDYYSYSGQNKLKADANAALWQLTKINTPAGGMIEVSYESDDYFYVQDRKAMQMYPLAGVGGVINSNSNYYEDDKIFVRLPEALPSDAALRARYFDAGNGNASQYLFFKALVKLKTGINSDEYVSGYVEIENVHTDVKLVAGRPDIAEIKVKKIKGEGVTKEYHPIAKAAWQFMRLNTPGIVYPGYNVREDLGPVQFVKALVGAITSISELLAPFDTRAEINRLAPSIDLAKSWVRLAASTNSTKKIGGQDYYAKLGGGSRVKEISMSDEWNSLSQSDAKTATYGMVFDYTTRMQLADGEEVCASSGVASYEPMIGNEENPFHQPTKYQQKIKLGPDNAFFIDEPLCESWFPAAGVGYSKVTVRNRGADGRADTDGYNLHEFYTQKDFPTIVHHTSIDVQPFGGGSILQLLKIKKNNSRVASQGFAIELNDMHGKAKSESVMDQAGNELSAVYYYYKTDNDAGPQKKLNNETTVLNNDGSVSNAVIGRDIEIYTDMRSQTSFTAGINVMMNVDAIYLLFAIVPVPVVLPLPNAEYTGFRSAATIKVVQQYGIPDKVIKRENGSQLTTENLAWDAGTGRVLLTRTQNEFDDPVYRLSYPAHWMYEKGMGQAYKNLGLEILHFTASVGDIIPSLATGLLVPGDELLIEDSTGNNRKYWVNNAGTRVSPRLVLIDSDGQPVTIQGNATIVRSGRRNMLDLSAGHLLSLVNPIRNGRLETGVFTKVLDATGNMYDEEWAIGAANTTKTILQCPAGYKTDFFGRCYKDTVIVGDPSYSVNTTIVRQKNRLYSTCGSFLTNLSGAYLTAGAADPAGTGKVLLKTPGIWQNGTIPCGTGTTGDLDGPLNRSGIWLSERRNNNYYNQWVGIKTRVFISRFDVSNISADGRTGLIFLGFGSQHSIEIRIDNIIVAARNRNADNSNVSPFRSWRIKPVRISLDQQHEIFIKVKNEVANSEAAVGVELYNNTYNELKASSCVYERCLPCNFCSACRTADAAINQTCNGNTYANAIWSTKCLVGQRFNFHTTAGGTAITDFDPICPGTLFTDERCQLRCRSTKRVYATRIARTYCDLPIGQVVNPYVAGLRGNWRLQRSFAYHTDRDSKPPYIRPGDPDIPEKTDIRVSGTYSTFSAFWQYEGINWLAAWNQPVKDPAWIKVSEATCFNQKGEEIENTDALNRYSAVQFGYLQSAVTAVAANARCTDIGYDGFEDYDFNYSSCSNPDSCNLDGHFSIRGLCHRYPSGISPDTSYAHTGRNALKVTAAVQDASITSPVNPVTGTALYTFTGNTMMLTDNGILKGFRPQAGKKYLVSAWIKDDGNNVQLDPATGSSGTAVEVITGGQTFSTLKAGPRIEGWRKVETIFLIPVTAADIKIRFRPGAAAVAWFDDIRVQPVDAQIKTYAYDNRSMRVLAELDENNFASFYEYDDEGVLIRVKKETERGIMTIKESRSTYRIKK